jgi:phosphatidylglycerol:prolipoprotein diacylglycerol transferase
MYPTLPFGSLSLPTAPIAVLIAITIGLEIAGRYGRRLRLSADDVWNIGLLAIAAGLLVARLWNVLQLWAIYWDEPGLIFSLRPSGFVFWPGVLAALLVGYLYLLRKALDPLPVLAAFTVGALVAGMIWSIGAFLTGSIKGLPSDAPWALPYFGERLHPVALYQAVGLWLLFVFCWLYGGRFTPGRLILVAALGYSLLRLVTDGFAAEATLVANLRSSQLVALFSSLALTLLLARTADLPRVDSTTLID